MPEIRVIIGAYELEVVPSFLKSNRICVPVRVFSLTQHSIVKVPVPKAKSADVGIVNASPVPSNFALPVPYFLTTVSTFVLPKTLMTLAVLVDTVSNPQAAPVI